MVLNALEWKTQVHNLQVMGEWNCHEPSWVKNEPPWYCDVMAVIIIHYSEREMQNMDDELETMKQMCNNVEKALDLLESIGISCRITTRPYVSWNRGSPSPVRRNMCTLWPSRGKMPSNRTRMRRSRTSTWRKSSWYSIQNYSMQKAENNDRKIAEVSGWRGNKGRYCA